jgi:hypothetical protein
MDKDFRAFLLDRGRMWKLSSSPLNVPIIVPGSEEFETSMAITPVFSGGVSDWSDNIFPTAQNVIVEWMEEVAADPEYQNPGFEVYVEEIEEEADGAPEEEPSGAEEAEPESECQPADKAETEN